MSRNQSYSRHQSKSKKLPSSMQFVSDSRVGSLSDIQIGDKKLNVPPRVSKSSASAPVVHYPSTTLQSALPHAAEMSQHSLFSGNNTFSTNSGNSGLTSALRQPGAQGQLGQMGSGFNGLKARGVQIVEPGQRAPVDFRGTGLDEQSYAEALAQFGMMGSTSMNPLASSLPPPPPPVVPQQQPQQQHQLPPQFSASHFPSFFPQQSQPLQQSLQIPTMPMLSQISTIPTAPTLQQFHRPEVVAASINPTLSGVASAVSTPSTSPIEISSEVFDDGTKLTINGHEIEILNGEKGNDGKDGEPGEPGKITIADEKTIETMLEKLLQPTITSISKSTAPIGTNLVISGRRFMRGAIISWGDQTISDVCVFENKITFVVPKFRVQKSLDVQISNPDFRLSNSVKFNYE